MSFAKSARGYPLNRSSSRVELFLDLSRGPAPHTLGVVHTAVVITAELKAV